MTNEPRWKVEYTNISLDPGTRLRDVQKRLDQCRTRSSLTKSQQAWILCIQEAIQAGMEENYSVGSVIIDAKQKIVGQGRNSVFKPVFRSDAHAEMNAINQLEALLPNADKDNIVLLSTLEPCLMCTARILLSGIREVIFLYPDETGGICNKLHLLPSNYRELGSRVRFVEYKEESELTAMAKDLYEIGEEIWNHRYRL